ncbi:MAG TPA: hypothetical protein VFZ91_12630 [Allosphingosinicella sp.]
MPTEDNTALDNELIAGLDPFTFRRLSENRPKDDETLSQLGFADNDIKYPMRQWINDNYRKAPKRKLTSKELKGKTTWAKLREKTK